MASVLTPTTALQPAGAGQAGSHLCHRSLGLRTQRSTQGSLKDEPITPDAVHYGFDLWGQQVADFCHEVIDRPVRLRAFLVAVALRAAQLLGDRCRGVVLIDCAQRLMDDKQLATQPVWIPDQTAAKNNGETALA